MLEDDTDVAEAGEELGEDVVPLVTEDVLVETDVEEADVVAEATEVTEEFPENWDCAGTTVVATAVSVNDEVVVRTMAVPELVAPWPGT